MERIKPWMGIPVQQTSLDAFKIVREDLGSRQEEVYLFLTRFGPANNNMIAQSLKMPINSITPRVKELREKKLVGVDHEEPCPITGRNTIFWRVV